MLARINDRTGEFQQKYSSTIVYNYNYSMFFTLKLNDCTE